MYVCMYVCIYIYIYTQRITCYTYHNLLLVYDQYVCLLYVVIITLLLLPVEAGGVPKITIINATMKINNNHDKT